MCGSIAVVAVDRTAIQSRSSSASSRLRPLGAICARASCAACGAPSPDAQAASRMRGLPGYQGRRTQVASGSARAGVGWPHPGREWPPLPAPEPKHVRQPASPLPAQRVQRRSLWPRQVRQARVPCVPLTNARVEALDQGLLPTLVLSDDGGVTVVACTLACPLSGNAQLLLASPAIDAADPSAPFDSNGTRADMGATPFDSSYVPAPTEFCIAKANGQGVVP
ncbi:MAG: hypothetical protein ACJAZN_003450 [Planctomycetota bacterium]|jgi:hypothetical protein